MRSVPAVLLVVIGVVLASCSLLGLDKNELIAKVSSDQQVYEIADSMGIKLTIENVSSSTIYYSTCDKQRFERLNDGHVISTSTIKRACRCLCLVSVKPGKRTKLNIGVGRIQRVAGQLGTGEETTYRLWPVLYENKDLREPIERGAIQASQFRFVE